MNMKPIEDLLPRVMPLAPSCPEPLALRHILEAARTYCTVMKVWREVLTQTIVAARATELDAIDDGEIVEIEKASLDGRRLSPISMQDLDALRPNWDEDANPGAARWVTQSDATVVCLYPRAAGTLTMRVCLKPALNATTVPAVLVDNYADVIGHGAAGMLLATPNVEFSNPGLAASHSSLFNTKIGAAAQRRNRAGHQNAPVRTRSRFF